MRRPLLAAVVVAADIALMLAVHRETLSPWGATAYALAVALVIALRYRTPMGAFAGALLLGALTGGAWVLLIWAAYQAGQEALSRAGMVTLVGVSAGGLAAQLVAWPGDPHMVPNLVLTYLVFVAPPLLTGRYLAQHRRLVSALDQYNRRLRWKREILAEQERLRERLRIARDMHDSLGRRLSLVSVQAAALEVSALPPGQRQAVQQLAGAARDAMNELYELVGALRAEDEIRERAPGVEAIGTVVAEFQAAGVPVTLRRNGEPRPLSAAAGHAAYRVVEEGLTNAAKYAPGLPVTVSVDWEPDALLLDLVNPLPDRPVVAGGAGHGLSGLGERVRPAGGFLDHGPAGAGFRLFAMLPTIAGAAPEETADAEDEDLPAVGHLRTVAIGFAAAVLMFVVLPGTLLLGVA